MSSTWYHTANEAEIPSPALLLFRERMERNLDQMVSIAGKPARLRPHVKTHKLGPIVKAQIARGIRKFKCATIAEAEMTAEAGAADVLLAIQPVGPAIGRFIQLQPRFPATVLSTIVDAEESIAALAVAAVSAGMEIPVFLDLDCGMGRTGVAPGPRAEELYQLIARTRGLLPAGLHAYDGHIHESCLAEREMVCERAFDAVEKLRARLQGLGLPVPCLVAGGTPTFPIHARYPERELSPGTCVLWDFGYEDSFADLKFEPAAVLLTRVVSKPGGNRLCLDLGHKAVAAEKSPPRVRLLELPDATPLTHSEEHLVIETPQANALRLGQCLHGIPRHICPTVALHNEAWIVEGGAARERWPIAARARRLSI
jgi:D-serine deaminase-like pyridoxal phosphate-dependent protein